MAAERAHRRSIEARIKQAQKWLVQENMDGWLLYDHHGSNRFVHRVLEIPQELLLTRRFFYWIPREGKPQKFLHVIESQALDFLPGEQHLYLSWIQLQKMLGGILKPGQRIVMEYSPQGKNPYISTVDGGTCEAIRSLGVDLFSSADLLQCFTSVLNERQIESHREAALLLQDIVKRAWEKIAHSLIQDVRITETDVQRFLLEEFRIHQCFTADRPICSVNHHSAMPHYVPSQSTSIPIQWGDWILIDLWCKRDVQDAIYADITQVAVAAEEPTSKQIALFEIVQEAQKRAIHYIKTQIIAGHMVRGSDVDDLCRHFIQEQGFGNYFTHRTGHNVDTELHGSGAHLDNLETSDYRQLLPGMCFTIEPGIYLPGEWGVRLETNIVIHHDRTVEVTGGIEASIICLGKK